MKVYLLCHEFNYEGFSVEGVYFDLDLATKGAIEYLNSHTVDKDTESLFIKYLDVSEEGGFTPDGGVDIEIRFKMVSREVELIWPERSEGANKDDIYS